MQSTQNTMNNDAQFDRERQLFEQAQPTGIPTIERPGTVLGRYKLLQELGEGGCGTVYVAQQEQPVRCQVAFKIIKPGMDSKSVLTRFEAERQALAQIEHPNIARVFDAGTTETGWPFFVTELVCGVPITDYCDEHALPLRERLDLFVEVCRAVQHAHQKGIIHRALKPSNILVTENAGGPVPKVIDFGIAKATIGQALSNQTMFTAFKQCVGTPAYMSPEQTALAIPDLDPRTDIYNLGVLLYELLTGGPPFDPQELSQAGFDQIRSGVSPGEVVDLRELLQSGFDKMSRTIREAEPACPSLRLNTLLPNELTITANLRHTDPPGLNHLIRGHLDSIVMKCLEKNRARRYETANLLAAEIVRFLSDAKALFMGAQANTSL
jgi:serine/threonine protein kinase